MLPLMFDLRDSSRPIGAAQLQAAEAPGTMKAANAAAFHPSGPQPTCLSALLITLASRARAGQEAGCNTPVLSELWNPVAGRPPLSERLHLIVLLPIPPPLPPDSVGDRHHGLVNQPIQCGGTGECAGRMRKPLARIAGRLRSCGTQWPPTFFVWARSVRCVPHVCTSVLLHFTCYAPPPPPDPIIPDATYAVTMVKAFQKKRHVSDEVTKR